MPIIDEYGDEYGLNRGGVWYYSQNKFGSDWFNKVDNKKGWTVDFNLRVADVQNSEWIIDENNKGKGVGIYVNDGDRQETINFLTQQIIFVNANHTKVYNTTQEVDYRLTGKEDNLKLYARPAESSTYKEISDVNFSTTATPNGNALNSSVFEDVGGNLHAVWWDDGGNVGSIFYSKFDVNNELWSNPEEIVSLDNGVQFPSIIVDSNENIYVAFESKQTDGSVIGFVFKNSIGWSDPYYIGVDIGYCKYPKLIFDSQSNACVVWEDNRQTHPEIYINIFSTKDLKWKGEAKLSTNSFGSYRPAIASYMDDLFISWTRKQEDNTFLIEVIKYNAIHATKSSVVTISNIDGRPDHSSILANVSGRIFVAWHDDGEGKYHIYSAVLSPSLDILETHSKIVEGHGGARYPVLSEQLSTGDVYIVWQDFNDGDYVKFEISDTNPSESNEYNEQTPPDLKPSNSSVYVAVYQDSNFLSSGKNSFDVKLVFQDKRNAYSPSVPVFFSRELPILYESYLVDEYGFIHSSDMLLQIRHAFYNLSRENTYFLVDYVGGPYVEDRDYVLNKNVSTREIRFGDFSDVINAHYVFKDFKYYLEDAVEPYSITEIGPTTIGVDVISAHDAVINNYGDVWIVGICGIYYYLRRQKRVLQMGRDLLGVSDNVEDEDMEFLKTFRAIAFDKYNYLFLGGDDGLYYSAEHIDGIGLVGNECLGVAQCQSDTECAGDLVCVDGNCVEPGGGCVEDSDCPEGTTCQGGVCLESGTPCVEDSDCSGGTMSICQDGVCTTHSTLECLGDSDCPEGTICQDGECAGTAVCKGGIPCSSDADCFGTGCLCGSDGFCSEPDTSRVTTSSNSNSGEISKISSMSSAGGTVVVNEEIICMAFDKNNNLYIGTKNSGLKTYIVNYSDCGVSSLSEYSISGAPTGHISSIRIDDNNVVWIGTYNGVYRFYKDKFLHFTTVHGLPSDRVNDIAVRNTAIRYIATSNGVGKMIGFNFEVPISSEDDSIWNNNVKSLMWHDPNVLFAGTLSTLSQIILDDVDQTYSTVFYQPASSINISPDDFYTYYLMDETAAQEFDILEVYINGNRIHHGYDVGKDNKTIRFRMPLNHEDIVEVIVRKDLEQISSFAQTQEEQESTGVSLLKLKDIAIDSSNDIIYTISSGDENEVKINDSNSILPFDKVHLDTHPPGFFPDTNEVTYGINIGPQIHRSEVSVEITGAHDNVLDDSGNIIAEGSGIDTMIIANNDQFMADDGVTPLVSVPFSTSVTHDLGLSLEDIVKDLTLESGEGTVVSFVRSKGELYAGASKPAMIYRYDWNTELWQVLFTYDEDQYIDFIAEYNEKLMVSLGHDIDPARINVYDYSTGSSLTGPFVLPLSESRAYDFHILNGKFYIGSGIGPGDVYVEGSGDSGAIYLFDDGTALGVEPNLLKVAEGIDDNVYALTSVKDSSNLLAASGPDSYIYEINAEAQTSFIVYNSTESLVSLFHQEDIGQTFAGGVSQGVIRRSMVSNNTYDISFRTIPSRISVLKAFPVITGLKGDEIYVSTFAAVGNTIYYLSKEGTWTWKYTHDEEINDMTFDDRENKNVLYVISAQGVTKIRPLIERKVIYLKLIDRAGNESKLNLSYDVSTGYVKTDGNPFVDHVLISSLVDFINENQILELDESGSTVYNLRGDNRFYSADKIEQEVGEYISEVFDGTNDLVKWETLSWEVTELFSTQVLMYVRTSTSQNDILIANWQGPYYASQSSGVEISHLSGQFIQFRAVLTSSEKGVTPIFHRASIRAITTEAIHFFTTNFVMPTKLNKGILTSEKIVPVSADIVFGVNTTNSIDWTEYQPVDENRIFNINQTGHNLRVGIKLISPNRLTTVPKDFGEYGPYGSDLYVNTIDFGLVNNTGVARNYHFRVSLFDTYSLTNQVFVAYSADSPDGFNVDGDAIPADGVTIAHGSEVEVLFAVPGSANIQCEEFYFVKIEYIYASDFELISNDASFVYGCTSSFIDNVDFDFTNRGNKSNNYHFRIKFYNDLERTSEYKTVFSGNDRTGWFVGDIQISEDGILVAPAKTVNVVYRPDPDDFATGTIYYLTIEAHDGDDYVFASNSYTFQIRDVQSTESCGGYADVPIVKNFGLMFELDNNEFITLNI